MSFAVILAELGPPLEKEADAIAALVGLTAFDVRVRASGTLPCELVRLGDLEKARAIVRKITERGHGALVVDTSALPSTVPMRRFHFDSERLYAHDDAPSVTFDEIVAIIRAASSTAIVRKTTEQRIGLRGDREEIEVDKHERATANVAHVFMRDRSVWILNERETKYIALGARMRPTAHENFLVTIDLLRSFAPRAAYDERFALHTHDSGHLAVVRGAEPATAGADMRLDVLTYALSRWLARGSGSQYRDSVERGPLDDP